jgi:hypothetical protein
VEDFLGSISREGLCTIASSLNNDLLCISDPVSCVPTFGTFNVVIPLLFENGEKWIARIPRPGRMFSQPNPALLEQIMHSMAVTTAIVRERTSIPVPQIHAWSSSDDNEAGCAYMFMDFVEGESLGDCLNTLPADKMSNVIYEWAMYQWELTRLSFPAIGCLGLSSDYQVIVQQYLSAGSVDQGRDTIVPFFRGPYTSVADYLFGISNLKKLAPLDNVSYDRFSFGTYLESMIPFALKPHCNTGPFYLTHDDFNVQNILINPNTGRITAILDWDYACVKPIQSLIAYPESLRWDLLETSTAGTGNSYEQYQVDWSRRYRKEWADAFILASRNIPTGCNVDVSEFLDDSPFFAELEKGLGESWREAEAMKFCNEVVYGEPSAEVLRLAARGMRNGPWMSIYGNRMGFTLPLDLKDPSPTPAPITPKGESMVLKIKSGMGARKINKKGLTPKICDWKIFRGRNLHRKRLRRVIGKLSHEGRQDDDISLHTPSPEKPRKRETWWILLARKLYGYGVKERTLSLE